MLLLPPLIVKEATLGWPLRTLAPQPQYSVILTVTSGILPGGVLPWVGLVGSIGIRVSDLPSFSPPGIWSAASMPGFRLLCRAMSRYCPVMPPARVVGYVGLPASPPMRRAMKPPRPPIIPPMSGIPAMLWVRTSI